MLQELSADQKMFVPKAVARAAELEKTAPRAWRIDKHTVLWAVEEGNGYVRHWRQVFARVPVWHDGASRSRTGEISQAAAASLMKLGEKQ